MRGSWKALAVVACGLAVATAGTTVGHAASGTPEDGKDTFNVPAHTPVTGTNSTPAVFTATDATFGTITVTCTTSTFSGRTRNGLKFNISPPTYADAGGPCMDSAAQTDTFTAGGAWSIHEKDAKHDEAADSTADKMIITMPEGGLVDVNSIGCTITFAPAGPASVPGQYDDAGHITISGASVPVVVSGTTCPVSFTSVSLTVNYLLDPALADVG